MKEIKNYLFALVFSVFGGLVAVFSYDLIFEDKSVNENANNERIQFANYILDTTNVVVPEGLNFIYTSKKTTPAVVHIRTTYEGRSTTSRSPFEDMFRDFFGERYDNREREMPKRRGSGSGVIMTEDGYIITNNHVIDNASEVEVLLNDNSTYKATVEGAEPLQI